MSAEILQLSPDLSFSRVGDFFFLSCQWVCTSFHTYFSWLLYRCNIVLCENHYVPRAHMEFCLKILFRCSNLIPVCKKSFFLIFYFPFWFGRNIIGIVEYILGIMSIFYLRNNASVGDRHSVIANC